MLIVEQIAKCKKAFKKFGFFYNHFFEIILNFNSDYFKINSSTSLINAKHKLVWYDKRIAYKNKWEIKFKKLLSLRIQ